MRILICPDKFAGTLSAGRAAEAIAEGWRQGRPDDETVTRPLADGGPGFLDVLAAGLLAPTAGGVATGVGTAGVGTTGVGTAGVGTTGKRRVPVPTVDPLGRPTSAELLICGDTGYLESAQACGLHLLSEAERDPRATTSYGLGVLVAAAVETGVRRVVIGLGGSATNDAGAGMLAALGAAPLDGAGYALPYGGAALRAVAGLGGAPRLRGAELIAATDVDSPLTGNQGASAVFGPQKGATGADVLLLDVALARFAAVLERDLPHCPPQLAALPGAGAAGGLGAAVLACGGRVVSGIDLVWRVCGLDAALAAADLVITGEGSFDAQSLRGKAVIGVARAARDRHLPCLVLAGRVSVQVKTVAAYSLVAHFGSEAEAMARPAEGLRSLAARLAAQWDAA